MKAYGLVLLCLQKKFFFAVGVARGDPIFAQVGPKNGIEVLAIFFGTTGFQSKLSILIESPNIFH